MPPVQSTGTSLVICKTKDGSGNNIRAGDEKTSPQLKQSSMESKSLSASKTDSQVHQGQDKSFNLFTWSDELDPSSLSAEEKAAKVVAETKAYQEITNETSKTQPKKKQKLTPPSEYVLKPEDEEYRRLLDTHEKWEEELSTVHGLSKAEAGLVCDVVMEHGQSESFPEEDPNANSKHIQLARPGWEQFRSIMACFMESKSLSASKTDSQVHQVRDKSFKLFKWSDKLDSFSLSAEEEAAKVVAETKAYQEITNETSKTQPKKKQKLTPPSEYVLIPEDEEYRRLLDAHEKWEEELSTVHGLSKAEAGLVCDVVMEHGESESFPKEDPNANSKHLQLARPGWEQFRSIMACFLEHVLPTGWHHKKDPQTGEWTVVKMGAH